MYDIGFGTTQPKSHKENGENVSENLKGLEKVVNEGIQENLGNIIEILKSRGFLPCSGRKFSNTVPCSNMENRKVSNNLDDLAKISRQILKVPTDFFLPPVIKCERRKMSSRIQNSWAQKLNVLAWAT